MDIREKIKVRMTEKVIRSKFLKKLYFSFWKIVLFFLAIINGTKSPYHAILYPLLVVVR